MTSGRTSDGISAHICRTPRCHPGNEVGSRWSPKLQRKHEIRQRFHPQLKRLWDTTPFLKTGGRSGPSALVTEDSPDIPPYDVAALGVKYSLYGWNFVPLVTEELNLICGLDILFLRPSAPGQLVSGGDLDNRLKTLFDALRIFYRLLLVATASNWMT